MGGAPFSDRTEKAAEKETGRHPERLWGGRNGSPPQGKFDYRKFLKRFAVPREEVELDTESFDYIFYNLGMERYGNTPLIEPLEYKEVNRLEELVIAIDTSSSVQRKQSGISGETYRILEEKENFFRK